MITDILQERTPEQKPRFFLHDEMVAWLADNLKLEVVHQIERSRDHQLQQKLSLYNGLPNALLVNIVASAGGVTFYQGTAPISLHEYERAMQCLVNVNETCMQKITQMEYQLQQLQRRLELLENPLPI